MAAPETQMPFFFPHLPIFYCQPPLAPWCWVVLRQHTKLKLPPNEKVKCTISLGVAVSNSRQAISPEQIIEQADTALYKAKKGGRNQVVTYQVEDKQYGSA